MDYFKDYLEARQDVITLTVILEGIIKAKNNPTYNEELEMAIKYAETKMEEMLNE